jgi:hypothetical protein
MTPNGVKEQDIRTWFTAMVSYFAMWAAVWRSGLQDALAAAEEAGTP